MENEIRTIFERVTERFEFPVRLSPRCETNVYYHVEDLSLADINLCAEYLADRVINVCYPSRPTIVINLPGSFTDLAARLSAELGGANEPLEVITLEQIDAGNGYLTKLKNSKTILVNDVITTARSCLRAHSRITVMGASILCWAALIDRTFGPGPVPVVAAFTGEPVTLLQDLP